MMLGVDDNKRNAHHGRVDLEELTMKRGDMPASPVSKYMADSLGLDRVPEMAAGMTIREAVALRALTSPHNPHNKSHSSHKARALWACDEADALLAELERTGGCHE